MNEIWKKRLSLKNIVLHIRKYIPVSLYNVIVFLRLQTFQKKCSCSDRGHVTYTDGAWVSRKVTKDQQAIEKYLTTQELDSKNILHIGIGNSHIAGTFASSQTTVFSITVVQQEIDYAESLKIEGYKYFLKNKNYEEMPMISSGFDYVIDNNLSSYACCMAGFHHMMSQYIKVLTPQGSIILGEIGIAYFDSGFGMTESFLGSLEEKYQLMVQRVGSGVVVLKKYE